MEQEKENYSCKFRRTPEYGVERRISTGKLARVMDCSAGEKEQTTENELKLLTTKTYQERSYKL